MTGHYPRNPFPWRGLQKYYNEVPGLLLSSKMYLITVKQPSSEETSGSKL
jgi:hypothetical protein